MFTEKAVVQFLKPIEQNIYLLKAYSPKISQNIKPGQFCNIKVSDTDFPLLRRPFSICEAEGDCVSFLFNIHGIGTKILSGKREGNEIDILGPLGNGFNISGNYDQAVIVAGGLGSAPFPYLINSLDSSKEVLSYVGAQTKTDLVTYKLKSVSISTDDGTAGFKGNVIELLEKQKRLFVKNVKLFGCGPTPMLKALQKFSAENNYECEISTECAMACGFGICQGCPIESTANINSYKLVCKDGPVFNSRDIVL